MSKNICSRIPAPWTYEHISDLPRILWSILQSASKYAVATTY